MTLTERDSNIQRKSSPAQTTPSTRSKLPRRVRTPSSTPTAAKWISSIADRTASREETVNDAQKDLPTTVAAQKAPSQATPSDKPLPGDKPLPPRPIARLSSALSPSKDTRSLIDACDVPLRTLSSAGVQQEWPSLTPQSAGSISTVHTADFADTSERQDSSNSSPSHATPASMVAEATTATTDVLGDNSTHEYCKLADSGSSDSSYASADDGDSPSWARGDASLRVSKTRGSVSIPTDEDKKSNARATDFPSRQASLRNRISDGSLVGPSHKFIGFTDFTRLRDTSITPTESRQHSPSPASFSRPRPGSLCHSNSRAIKTASRIPVPDTKKASVVEVRNNRLSGTSIAHPTTAPSFGSRRLASPEALRILEEGKIRRQLKRMPRDADVSGAQMERTWSPDSSTTAVTTGTPSLSYSLNSSPMGTMAPNSPETAPIDRDCHEIDDTTIPEDKIACRNDWQNLANSEATAHPTPQTEFNPEGLKCDMSIGLGSPPPTSPFTVPLQTIPSQAALPITDAHNQEEASTELTRTLSRLEGQGSPPKTDVDQQTLMHMFGHLKRSIERNTHTDTTIAENAAAAEKYLAQHPSSTESLRDDRRRSDQRLQRSYAASGAANNNKAESLRAGKRKHTLTSKWSTSTPSDKGISPAADGLCAQNVAAVNARRSISASKDLSSDRVSTGHLSRDSARMSEIKRDYAETKSSDKPPNAPQTSRRESSPTLGKNQKPKPKPGSVRTAREGIQPANSSFTRTTLSADSKRTTRTRLSNPKIFTIPEAGSRGRTSPAQKHQSRKANGVTPKTPRSRSRSRYVLDRINGMFSGKRDRKSQAVPPVPRTETCDWNTGEAAKANIVEISTYDRSKRAPQLSKMPSMSPSTETAYRNGLSNTASTDDTATLYSNADTQSVQNLSEHVLGKAQREINPQRKERLLNFAKVLNDSLISAREAQISAETARCAAKNAQMSYEMIQQSLAMLQRLAASIANAGDYGRR